LIVLIKHSKTSKSRKREKPKTTFKGFLLRERRRVELIGFKYYNNNNKKCLHTLASSPVPLPSPMIHATTTITTYYV